MNRLNPLVSVSAISFLLAVVVASGQVHAVTQFRQFASNPADNCQSALPVFDVQIRKRPLGVQNEGSTPAFVTCAYGVQSEIQQTTRVEVGFNSRTGIASALSCVFVAGTDDGFAQYVVKSVNLAGDGTQSFVQFNPSDFGGGIVLPNGPYGISCNLQPGMAINESYRSFNEDVGM